MTHSRFRIRRLALAFVAGQTTYRDATTHWAENVGTTTLRLIIVELKEHP